MGEIHPQGEDSLKPHAGYLPWGFCSAGIRHSHAQSLGTEVPWLLLTQGGL